RCELPEDVVAGEMAELVVDLLEVVQVAEDERDRPAEACRARELRVERVLRLTAVGETGQGGDERLALHDRVQSRVLERDDRVAREGDRGERVLLVELVAEERQLSEVRLAGTQRDFDAVLT